jgi:hypothetical protein
LTPENDHNEFVQVVPPLPFGQADEEFRRWLRLKDLDRAAIPDGDIRVDIVRDFDGRSKRRYLVRKRVIDAVSR